MADLEPIVGRYLRMPLAGRPHRVYFEEAGQGLPLVCLHTAGADGRQFRHLLNDAEVTRHFRVIAFDMPWHGKSLPPVGWQDEEYTLTTRGYVDLILAFCTELGVARPVVLGCSIHEKVSHALPAWRKSITLAMQPTRTIGVFVRNSRHEIRKTCGLPP